MAYHQTPTRRHLSGSPAKMVPEGPIQDLTRLVTEETESEDWQLRVTAFEDLVQLIPDGSLYLDHTEWFNTPKILNHLAFVVNELLKDPRSTVVRRVCVALTSLFAKCQSDARLLFKDIMPTVLQVHAQTVQIIRNAVQTMVSESIPEVPCKSAMPIWMERLKDKSPAVRDACSLYLGLALQHWTEENYLTDEIWIQVGNCLLKTMRDPSPQVRTNAKISLERMRSQHPHRWQALIGDETGPASQDPKLMRWLTSLERNEEAEDLSIASKYTYNSDSRFANRNNPMRISSPRVAKITTMHDEEDTVPGVPISIAVKQSREAARAPFSHVVQSPPIRAGTPPRPPMGTTTTTTRSNTSPQVQTYIGLTSDSASWENKELEYSESSSNMDILQRAEAVLQKQQEFDEANPFISNIQELKQYATKRRSRNSIMMQQRFRSSNHEMAHSIQEEKKGNDHDYTIDTPSPLSDANTNSIPKVSSNLAKDTTVTVNAAPEHMIIAIRLLRSHKSHVDQIMETLKIEMDTLRDFDRLLEEPGRPTEEELINYYEAVDLCLSQRYQSGQELRREMDGISSGESLEK